VALIYDPIARDQLREMRNTFGPRYVNAVWAQRAFEQETRNEEAMVRWRSSYPVWDRLFGRPATDLNARIVQVVATPAARSENSKAA
jgi:hypothetical protein